jgi:hypothetical protein
MFKENRIIDKDYSDNIVNQLVVKGNFIAPFFLIGAGYNGHVFIRSIKRLTKNPLFYLATGFGRFI